MENKVLYGIACSIVNKLKSKGLITEEEGERIDAKNKKSFLEN